MNEQKNTLLDLTLCDEYSSQQLLKIELLATVSNCVSDLI